MDGFIFIQKLGSTVEITDRVITWRTSVGASSRAPRKVLNHDCYDTC